MAKNIFIFETSIESYLSLFHRYLNYRFYEIVESIGEGSMGSVSKVRKKDAVIGGSARPEFIKKHSRHHSSMGWFSKSLFCPFASQNSRALSGLTTSEDSDMDESGQQQRGCFATWFGPPQNKYSDVVLESASEDESSRESFNNNKQKRCFCFGGNSQQQQQSSRSVEESMLLEEHQNLKREVERALKHSASSLITYGHKDVVYALKSIHLDRVSSADFMKELKNEGMCCLFFILSMHILFLLTTNHHIYHVNMSWKKLQY